MTYSILARCSRTGRLGLAIATYTVCVGLYTNGVRAKVGATMTQSSIRQQNNGVVLDLLAQGLSVEQVLDQLRLGDAEFEYRQIGIVDGSGRAAAYSGPLGKPLCAHRIGGGYVALGSQTQADEDRGEEQQAGVR